MKTKNYFRDGTKAIVAFLFAAVMTLGFAACSEKDLPVTPSNPLGSQVVGLWYHSADVEGTLPNGWGYNGKTQYTRIVSALLLNDNGTGYACTLWFDNEKSTPVFSAGGFDAQGLAPLSYTTTQDGRIILRFDQQNTNQGFADYFGKWTLSYADGTISCSDGSGTFQMQLASDAMKGWIYENYRAAAGGSDEVVSFNINDQDFNADNWHNQQSIYLNNGKIQINEANQADRNSYLQVNLPWSDGDIQTNLPDGFCNSITPENGWQWAYNLCGSRSITNGNFFMLYNKYTGILRIFYYMPDFGTKTGNDHVWQVLLNPDLAKYALWGYGLPSSVTFQGSTPFSTGSGTMVDVVTPWTELTVDGSIEPNVGWWAFDVDLSLYRHEAANFDNDNSLRLQMFSWESGKISLYSTMTADIDGTIKQEISKSGDSKAVSIAKGVLSGIQGVLNIASGISGFMKGEPAAGFMGFANCFGCGNAIAGLFGGGAQPFEGHISLGMNGSISSSGYTQDISTTVGVASPTIKLKNFYRSNAPTLGQGVWNIKSNPKVYVVNDLSVDWRRQDMDVEGNDNNLAYPEKRPSPFGGWANTTPLSKDTDRHWPLNEKADKPFRGLLCVFDPSSIEVELNPNVFPEGTTYQVYAVCGVNQNVTFGSTEAMRTALGLKGSQIDTRNIDRLNNHISDRPLTEAAFDGLYGYPSSVIGDFAAGAKFDSIDYKDLKCGMFGRGTSDVLVEPMGLIDGTWDYCLLPPYQVTVFLTVNANGQEYLYSRTYLPEYEEIAASKLAGVYANANTADRTHFSPMYSSQMAHLQAVCRWVATTPICDNSIQTYYRDGNDWTAEAESGYSLIDGDPSTLWGVKEKSRNTYWDKYNFRYYGNLSVAGSWTCSWMEFHTLLSNKPKSFTVVCSKRTNQIPRDLRLFAKNSKDDDWVEIYMEENFNKRLEPKEGATVVCDIPADKQDYYQYYRVEGSGGAWDYSLAELTINYE